MKGESLKYVSIPIELGLFRSTGYKWRHNVAERDHLRDLHMKLHSPVVPHDEN